MRKPNHLLLIISISFLLGACSSGEGGEEIAAAATQTAAQDQPIQGFPTPDINDPRYVYWNGIPVLEGAFDVSDRERAYIYFVVATTNLVRNYYNIEMEGLGWRQAGTLGQGSDSIALFFERGEEKANVNIIPTAEDETVLRIILNYSSGISN